MEGPEPNGVIAVFSTREDVDNALEWLQLDEVEPASLSILGPGFASERPPELDHSRHHDEEVGRYWAKWGATIGGVVGAGPVSIGLAAATVGLGPLAMVIAAGVGAVAATAGLGALAAGLVGAGVHHRHAVAYEKALQAGKYVLVVHSDDPSTLRSASEELARLRAESVTVHGLRGAPPPRAAPHARA